MPFLKTVMQLAQKVFIKSTKRNSQAKLVSERHDLMTDVELIEPILFMRDVVFALQGA